MRQPKKQGLQIPNVSKKNPSAHLHVLSVWRVARSTQVRQVLGSCEVQVKQVGSQGAQKPFESKANPGLHKQDLSFYIKAELLQVRQLVASGPLQVRHEL